MKKFLSVLLSLTMLLALSLPAAASDPAAVDFVVEQGYMLGTGSGFDADGDVTRAMACQVLYNMAGRPEAAGTGSFTDTAGQWYAPAAAWAKEAGLVSGNAFDGSAVLSGAELTAMLSAYAVKNGRVLPAGAAMYSENVTRGALAQLLYDQAPWTGGFTETKVSFNANGRKVTAVVTMPTGDGKFPAVVMNHGHGGSKDEGVGFAGIARALADKGIASIRMDFPGCGESTEPFTANCLSNMVEDSNACRDYLVSNYSVDDGRLGVLGYSMGGRITSTIISQGNHGYQAVVLLAGAVGDGKAMAEGAAGGSDQFPAAYAEAKEKGYYRVTTRYGQVLDLSPEWFDDLRNIDPLENVSAFTGPVLIMYGDQDTVVPAKVNKLSLEAYPNAEEVVVPGADHGYAFYQANPKVTDVVEDGIAGFFAENLVSAGSSEKAGYSEKTVTFSVPEQDGIPAHEVVGTLTLPTGASGPVPGVVMLHGTGSNRHEAGNGYDVAAPLLAKAGLASLRIDFMGAGDSPASDADYSPSSANIDAKAAADQLAALEAVDGGAIGIMGWSQGGMNAMLAAAAYPNTFKAVVTWAGGIGSGKNEANFEQLFETAKKDGYTVTEYDWRDPMRVGLRWYEDMAATDVLEKVAGYPGPILAIQGMKDTSVVPETATKIVNASPNAFSKTHMIEDCDHTFNAFSGSYSAIEEAATATAEYLLKFTQGYSEKTVTFSVPEQDGIPAHEVVGTLTLPTGASGPVPGVVMLHGTGSNRHEAGNGYDVAAPLLAKAGLASLRIDFMGAGDSKARDVDYCPSSANFDAKAAADYLAALEAVDGGAIGIMGWSQGGLNTMLAAAAYPDTFKAAVTWAGATDMKNSGFAQSHETAKKDGYTVTEYDWREPMRVGVRWYDEMAATDVLKKVSEYPGPILAIQGADDVIVAPETAGKIVEASTNSASKTHMIEGCDHTFNVFSGSFSAIEEAAAATAEYLLKHVQGYREKEVSISVPEQDGIPAHEVPGTLTLPAKASGAPAVVMLHGTGTSRNESSNAFARLAQSLAEAGIASLRIDFMGCGASTANNADFCPTSAIIDAKASADYLASLKEVDGSAIGVMGWSQGGMDALLSAAAHPDTFKAVVTWAGAISMDGAGIFGDVSFEDAYKTAKETGEAIAPRWVGDPMHVGVRWFEEVQSMDTLAELTKYPGPILAVHGKDDSTVPPESAEQIVKASSNSASRTHLVENCEHTFNVFTDDTATMDGVIAETSAYFVKQLG